MQHFVPYVTTPDWANIPAVTLEHTGWLPTCPISAQAQICHDGKNLYIRMEAQEQEIRATLSGPLDQVCNDSCLEFFFAPMSDDKRYFNFECNPLGNLYVGFGAERPTRVRQLVKDPKIFDIRPFYTDGGWGVSYTIPGDFIRMYAPDFSFSGTSAGNFYKCGDMTKVRHYLSWSMLTCELPDYHRRQDFGQLVFGSPDK